MKSLNSTAREGDRTRGLKPVEKAGEAGQAIVLIALVFVILLSFVALAADAGFAFMRSSQFSRAVDAATLAGVVDLDPSTTDTAAADLRAAQFLAVNGWPTATLTSFASDRSLTELGFPEYTLTVTWPVSLFFARVMGFESIPVTHHASAAYYSQAEMYAPSAFDRGQIRKATQFAFGPDSCTQEGDPVSPLQSTFGTANEGYTRYDGVYHYRISMPETYTRTLARVELLDPDSVNLLGNSDTVAHSLAAQVTLPATETLDCGAAPMGERCIIDTGESLVAPTQNPFWPRRLDENWDASCNPVLSDGNGDTVTEFELFYLDASGERQSLAKYTDDNSQTADTDMKWVTPGVTANVNVDPDSVGASFDVNVSALLPEPDNVRRFYMDVKTLSGSAKNGWDIRVGPTPDYYTDQGLAALSPDVNVRNVQLADNVVTYDTAGVTTFALGRMPLDHLFKNHNLTFDLAPIDISLGNGTIYASLFDFDTASPPPNINFTIDTLSTGDFSIDAVVVGSPADPTLWEANCGAVAPENCNNEWTFPQWRMGIPSQDSSPPVRFAGGNLVVTYNPGRVTEGDAHTWSLALTSGRPILTR